MGKVHGSLAHAGKVRGQIPKVAKQDKKKKHRSRAYKFVGFGKNPIPQRSRACIVRTCDGVK
ncbi:40S ribosomal protein S30 [Morus notabilis]|uniref:40S ribosomal protein S30 n=1 Tax=Morus notabilis TaxID=981085 RepID=W9S190_9ROSA|nr:40S ribosomal protein S30 [Morus notabilis]